MLSIKEYNQSKDIKGLVQKLFESRQVTHDFHLKSKKYSEHVALEEYYSKILNLIDNFVETYQGQHGILEGYEISVKRDLTELKKETPEEYLENCVILFKSGRDAIKDHHLQHMLDEIISLTYKTIYKLKFLK